MRGETPMSDPSEVRDVELRMQLLQLWYGKTILSDEQWENVRKGIVEELTEVSELLRTVPLKWEDEPLPMFMPYSSDNNDR